MGREAECVCRWGDDSAPVKALLESGELILRGGLRRRVPFAGMEKVRADADGLVFSFRGDNVTLVLGEAIAEKWRQIILAPPVTLAVKLGITSRSVVRVIGVVDDSALEAVLSDAAGRMHSPVDLIVACIRSREDLMDVLRDAAAELAQGTPIWIVYPKGKGHAVNEAEVLSAGRQAGLADSKVASISSVNTGLRFALRKEVHTATRSAAKKPVKGN